MSCLPPVPIYLSHARQGLKATQPQKDGYSVSLEWAPAYKTSNQYTLVYNVYYSTLLKDVFNEGVKSVVLDDGYQVVSVYELTPGDTYYFAVRASQHDSTLVDPTLLPDGFPDSKIYPETILTSNISDSSLIIPVADLDQFPEYGVIQVGTELIIYSSKDDVSSSLIASERGYLNSNVRSHQVDGYDGYYLQDPIVKFWKGFEESNDVIHQATCKFSYPEYPFTYADGYREKEKDLINTDLSADEAEQIDFQVYDYAGWHRTDPKSLLDGACLGTYSGGEQFCADGYGVGFQLRGLPFNEVNNQRQEMLLEVTGEPCVLLRRKTTGITCSCMQSSTQNPALRCPKCLGSGFQGGYDQYFFSRRSDGRILVRFDATEEEIKIEEEGLESSFLPNCWTLTVPVLKSRDVIIRFNEDGTEEFRYKVMKVTRNRLINSLSGAQKFGLVRVRRTDPIYHFLSFNNTATMPAKLLTSIGWIAASNGTETPHTHEIVINENILSLTQINQNTSISAGHSHEVRNGVVGNVLGHTHQIILP